MSRPPDRPTDRTVRYLLLPLLPLTSTGCGQVNTQDTLIALKVRRDLTGESFNDGTIAVWTEALAPWPMPTVRKAIINAAKEHNRVTIAHIVGRLPQRTPPTTHLEHCELCDGTGWVDEPRYHSRRCRQTEPCHCHGVTPCRCTRGRQMVTP